MVVRNLSSGAVSDCVLLRRLVLSGLALIVVFREDQRRQFPVKLSSLVLRVYLSILTLGY